MGICHRVGGRPRVGGEKLLRKSRKLEAALKTTLKQVAVAAVVLVSGIRGIKVSD